MIEQQANTFLANFSELLQAGDTEAVAALFHPECYWRDLVAFTWNLKTVESPAAVRDMLDAQLPSVQPKNFSLAEHEAVTETDGAIEAWFNFETAAGRGYGLVRLRDGKVWTLLTTLQELKGFESPTFFNRPMGAKHGNDKQRTTWLEDKQQEAAELGYTKQPYCVIIGGGQGGIALGARLKALNIPTIIIEKNPRAGDSWRNRYKSLCLHDPVWYDHLPFLKFPSNWPVFTPKDKLGDWLEMYTQIMELNYWSSTSCENAHYDEQAGEWLVDVVRDGKPVTLRPKQLILATGMSGKANIPSFPGQDTFRGEQQHSSRHPGPDAYQGKKVVVIGSNNSAHDICAALWENDVDVTMVQRSSTHIVRSDSLMKIALGSLYSEEAVQGGMSTEKADLIFASLPYRIMHQWHIPLYDQMREQDAEFYQRLENVGFKLDWGADGSGLFLKYLRRGSGYYIDIGASELVANGDIKLASGQISHLTENAVVLDDGTELPADLIVYATGFGSMNGWAAELISQQVADKVGKCWGLGSDTPKDPGPWEGEQRNMWKPTQQQALWFHGGNLHQSRHYSLYLSMQIKARMEGLNTPVYGLQEVHHLS
ncbi:NAD(P)/FAD-dependent oxidoreductase [Halioxenophilus aromaticivorans]|uniref:NAD(P)/FAD-dependent oxidoreductase n=1 Tax=Halioxenophilus aromaticivorans TaxID=1306992 RepID=A0AAV3U0U5_9ALTE